MVNEGNTQSPLSPNEPYTQTSTVVQQPESDKKFPTKLVILIIIIVLISAGIGIFAFMYTSKNRNNPTTKLNKQTVPTPTISIQATPTPYFGDQRLDLQGTDASAEVFRSRNKNFVTHRIEASLPEAEVGRTYQAWVSNETKTILLGNLERNEEGLYVLETRYDFPQTPTGSFDQLLNTVTISLESTLDDTMETIILRGNFTL